MLKKIFFIFLCAYSAALWAEKIELVRTFLITTCYTGQKCLAPVVKEEKLLTLTLERFTKGAARGMTVMDRAQIEEQAVPFKSEVRLTKKEGQEAFSIYVMLRSGEGTQREGKVKVFTQDDLAQMKEVKVTDKAIAFTGGTLQASLLLKARGVTP